MITNYYAYLRNFDCSTYGPLDTNEYPTLKSTWCLLAVKRYERVGGRGRNEWLAERDERLGLGGRLVWLQGRRQEGQLEYIHVAGIKSLR